MHRRDFLFGTAAVAVSPLTLGLRPALAQTQSSGRWAAAVKAQERYEQVVTAGLGEPYIAPLRADRNGPRYLWGGLDPIALRATYERTIAEHKGGIVFMSWRGTEVGRPEFALDVPIYMGGPAKPALFVSAENRDGFRRQSADGTLMVMFGLNCLWGLAAGPATAERARPQASHWAQPGLAGIFVEKFPNAEGREVTTIGTALYTRAPDWHAVREPGWKFAAESFETLLQTKGPWRRIRPYMPVVELDWDEVGSVSG